MSYDDPIRELARRVAARWTPPCWFAFVVEAIPESWEDTVEDGIPARVHRPPHYLVAVWEPVDAPPLLQWPNAAAIVNPSVVQAAAETLRLVAPDAPIIMLDRDDVNTVLIADMILAADRHLDTYYRGALERFVNAERARWQSEITQAYTDRDEAFERFRDGLLKPPLGGIAPE
ncbi:MAG TPA: hypothetical protein VFS42_11230 [Burkholderiaceae bacterium]|nr:hypothetical protein [Burkholderiaceae bacterium]